MKTKIIEAVHEAGLGNWGKFLIGRLDDHELGVLSAVSESSLPLVTQRGWANGYDYFLMLDIETGEGAIFRHGGYAKADLKKHRIWTCPLFEPTLERLYELPLTELDRMVASPEPLVLKFSRDEVQFALAIPRNPGAQDTEVR